MPLDTLPKKQGTRIGKKEMRLFLVLSGTGEKKLLSFRHLASSSGAVSRDDETKARRRPGCERNAQIRLYLGDGLSSGK